MVRLVNQQPILRRFAEARMILQQARLDVRAEPHAVTHEVLGEALLGGSARSGDYRLTRPAQNADFQTEALEAPSSNGTLARRTGAAIPQQGDRDGRTFKVENGQANEQGVVTDGVGKAADYQREDEEGAEIAPRMPRYPPPGTAAKRTARFP